MKKKLLKYSPMIYALWSNPETRAKVVSTLESVNAKVQQVAARRGNPATATVDGSGRMAMKTDQVAQKVPAPIFTYLAKAMDSLTKLLAKQHAKASNVR